jgi:two-component system sensor histidine kinase NreB
LNASLGILLLEDVFTDAELVTHELRQGGFLFTTRQVQTRAEFEEALRASPPDVILADYSLPTFDGLSALAIARREIPDVPFIFVSGAIGEERAIEALKMGATDYVLKDRLGRLVPAVQRALQEVDGRTRRRLAEASLRDAVLALSQQAQRLQSLHEVDQAILAARSAAEIAQAVVQRIRQIVPCQAAGAVVFDFEAGRGQVLAVDASGPAPLHPGEMLSLDDLGIIGEDWQPEVDHGHDGADGGDGADGLGRLPVHLFGGAVHSWVSIPLKVGGRLIGVLALGAYHSSGFTAQDRQSARQLADSLAVAIHNARLHEEVSVRREQLQDLSRRLVDVQENERRYVALELHDEAAQGLTALMVKLGLLQREMGCSSEINGRLEEVKNLAGEVLEGLHDLAVDLRPVALDKLGLPAALRQYIERFGRQYSVAVQAEMVGWEGVRLASEIEIGLYRIVQEALTNIARHAQASNVAVILEHHGGQALLIIEDNGVGFDPAAPAPRGRLGLFGMRERVTALGGNLTVESAVGMGTTLYVEVPLGADSYR